MQGKSVSDSYLEQPVYWFAILESAREKSDFDQAARAKRELERLGVRITYRRPQGEAAPCH